MQILIIGFPAWEGNYIKSTVEIARNLAAQHDVVYVEYPFTYLDVAREKLQPQRERWKRITGITERLRPMPVIGTGRLHVLTLPPFIPCNGFESEGLYDFFQNRNAQIAKNCIKKSLSSLHFDPEIVMTALNPMLGVPLHGLFPKAKSVYYCYDEISAAAWLKNHGSRYEQKMLALADAVICSSDTLALSKQLSMSNKTFVVKNGVDSQFFQPSPGAATEHKTKPVVGYIGSIDERLDYQLLEAIIMTLPELQFVFTGRVNSTQAEALKRHENVLFTGPKPPELLPSLIRSFDVCLIPFLKNKLTAGIYPMKINEYLACGRAVVSTDFGDVADFKHLIHIEHHIQGFISAIRASLEPESEVVVESRVKFAEGNTWQKKAEAFTEVFEKLLISKGASKSKTTHTVTPKT